MNKKKLITIVAVMAVILLACTGLCGCMNNAKNENVTDVPSVSAPAEEPASTEAPAETQNAPADSAAEPETQQTEAVDNEETTTQPAEETEQPDETTATEQPTEPATDAPVTVLSDYQRYHNMTGEEQQAFIDNFESIEAFFEWYNAAKAEHEKMNPSTEIGGGNIDLGDLAGGNG